MLQDLYAFLQRLPLTSQGTQYVGQPSAKIESVAVIEPWVNDATTGRGDQWAQRAHQFGNNLHGPVDMPLPMSVYNHVSQVPLSGLKTPQKPTMYVSSRLTSWATEYVWHANSTPTNHTFSTGPAQF